MPTRLVPVAAAAVLFGLAGLQDPIARDPFGAATIAVDYGQLAAIWRTSAHSWLLIRRP
jgi:hypothetical protein